MKTYIFARPIDINFILDSDQTIDIMKPKFKIGDHVTWNSEAGHVSGTIIKVYTEDFQFKGYTHHANEKNPQYEIKSDKTDHIAAHRESSIKKL